MTEYLFDTPSLDLQQGVLVAAESAASGRPITYILPLIVALIVSMVAITLMVRLAPRFGLLDKPSPRKVHAQAIPRVGGFGIFAGAMMPIILLLPLDQTLSAFIVGALVLFIFGVLDDSRELGHYVKFVGQFIAVIIVVYLGDVYVTKLPFLAGEQVGDSAGRLFTVFAMVGMINAINHSDGLDGLAGGEALLSLCCIAWLAYAAGGFSETFIALSLVGGLLGFMRYNTYPAIIFMGDGGSQFIGYALGFLAVQLTQNVNTALSPALPALILGLPIADIIAVFAQRAYKKMNWFRASRNHIHHRLLDLGLRHYESVVTIYTVQALLVIAAVMMPYESDGIILGTYLVVVAMVFTLLWAFEQKGWRAHAVAGGVPDGGLFVAVRMPQLVSGCSYWFISAGLSLSLVSGSLIATRIPADFTLLGMLLLGLTLMRMLVAGTARFMSLRALCYMVIAFVVYLVNMYQPGYLAGTDYVTYVFFGLMMLCTAIAIRFSEKGDFNLTPSDFLVVLAVSSLAILSSRGVVDSKITAITLQAIILFYACELVLTRMKYRWNIFTVSVLVSLAIISLRGMGFM